MTILASLSDPSSVDVAAFLGVFFFLAAGINQVMKLVDRAKNKPREIAPQPFEVREYSGIATERDCKERHEALKRELQADKSAALSSRNKIYEEIRQVQGRVEEKLENVRREMGSHTESVRRELSDKMDGLPDRVITTLKNTGALE